MRFSEIGRTVGGVSQTMPTQTLRQIERDGLPTRPAHAVVPHRAEYQVTDLGFGLGKAFCGVRVRAVTHLAQIAARAGFDARHAGAGC